MLDMTLRDIEKVLYFEAFIVTEPGMTELEKGQLLSDDTYLTAIEEYGDEFEAKMGAEAIQSLLRSLDLDGEITRLREEILATNQMQKLKSMQND